MRKAKASLIASIAVGLLAITTAGVSTYAWFQASANATVQTVGNDCEITVAKPDDFVFYKYNGNKTTYTPGLTDNNDDGVIDFYDDFTPLVSSSDMATETSLTGMYPGQAMTFAIKLTNVTSASVDITKVKSNDSVMEGLSQNRYVSGQGSATAMPVNVGWAMNVFATSFTTKASSNYTTFVGSPSGEDKFKYDELDNTQAGGNYIYHRAYYLAGATASNVVTLTRPINIFSTSSTSDQLFIVYSVVFSNNDSTYFNEVDGYAGSPNVINVPPESGNRYFSKNTSGNSNCYASLSFALKEIKISQ